MTHPTTPLAPLALLIAALCLPGLALAQYKVVQPDGSVIYTDRPPANSAGRVTPMGPNRATPSTSPRGAGSPTSNKAAAEALAAGLPTDLRAAVLRYPVTLYATTECAPCDHARRMLQGRGVPFLEKRVNSEEDAQALERLLGARALPALMIGPQPLRGYVEADWGNYLDAAGYPRESQLPKGWKAPQVSALAERAAAPTPPAAPAPRPSFSEPSPAATGAQPAASGIRF